VLFDHPGFGKLAQTEFLTVRTSIWIMVGVVIVFAVLLARTTAGRYMYAAGGNAEAARLSGVRVDAIRVLTFVCSGTAAALAGVIDASRVLSAGGSTENTASLAFTVLAGIVVGGTSILGGDGAVWRTVVGVLLIALIGNGYILLGLDPLYEQITLGVILIAAVSLDTWSRRRRGWPPTIWACARRRLTPPSRLPAPAREPRRPSPSRRHHARWRPAAGRATRSRSAGVRARCRPRRAPGWRP
jgi:ribose transport system permease protein